MAHVFEMYKKVVLFEAKPTYGICSVTKYHHVGL